MRTVALTLVVLSTVATTLAAQCDLVFDMDFDKYEGYQEVTRDLLREEVGDLGPDRPSSNNGEMLKPSVFGSDFARVQVGDKMLEVEHPQGVSHFS